MHAESKTILWHAPMYEHQGFATHSRELALRLIDRLPGLRFLPTTSFPQHPEPTHLRIRDLTVPTGSGLNADLVIQCTPTTPYTVSAKYKVLLTTIESAKPHHALILRCTLHDELWVVSDFNYRILPRWLKRRMPVKIMPEGADPTKFYPMNGDIPPYRGVKKLFTFHSDWQHRKGPHTLIPAWCNVHHLMPDAALLLITKHGMCTEPEAVQKLLAELYALIPKGKSLVDLRILLVTHTIPDAQLNKIYNQTYCGVLPTRGEAWSLFPCQLAAAGKPVITTAHGGHLHYLNNRNAYLISVSGFGELLPPKFCKVGFYNYMPFPIPDGDHLEKLFLFAYNHPDDVQRRGNRAYHAVIPRYTWDAAADRVYERIEQICSRL